MKKWQEILYLHPKIKRNLLKRVYYFTEVWYIMSEVIMEYSYFLFLLLLVPCMIFSAVASAKVSSTYSKYDKIPCLSRMTGYDTATALLRNRGVSDISVGIVKGTLTDHYDPTKSIVNLSQSTFGSASVGACAVAGHEIGHVMQKKQGYFPYKLRKILVPITNIGSRLAMPVIIVGIFLDLFLFATKDQPYGQWILYVGIALYGLSTLFALVTLPVEIDLITLALRFGRSAFLLNFRKPLDYFGKRLYNKIKGVEKRICFVNFADSKSTAERTSVPVAETGRRFPHLIIRMRPFRRRPCKNL